MITSVMLRASNRYRSSSAYDTQLLLRANVAASASPAAQSVAGTIPSAASAALPLVADAGSRSSSPAPTSRPAAARVKIEATATTRRDPASAASSGTMTSQTPAKEAMPPLDTAAIVTSPVKASDDSTRALS